MYFNLSLSNLLTKAAREVTRHYQQAVAPYGISASQAGLVFFVAKMGPASQVEIARVLHLDKTNVHAMIRKLTAAGLLDLVPDAIDRRRTVVALTARGQELAGQLETVDQVVGAHYQDLAGPDAAVIRRFLEAIVFDAGDSPL